MHAFLKTPEDLTGSETVTKSARKKVWLFLRTHKNFGPRKLTAQIVSKTRATGAIDNMETRLKMNDLYWVANQNTGFASKCIPKGAARDMIK